MRPLRSLTNVILVTLVALMYVHQHVELVKMSYRIDAREKQYKELLDRKETLQYTINNLEAPSRLESILSSRKIDVIFPKKGQVVKLTPASRSPAGMVFARSGGTGRSTGGNGFFAFLSQRSEAHATER